MAEEPPKPIRKPTDEVLELLARTEKRHALSFSDDESRAVDGYLALEHVNLTEDQGEALPKILSDLGEFDTLVAAGKAIQREEDIDAVCKLVFLKDLVLGGPHVTDELVPRLSGFTKLTHLTLRDGSISGQTLGNLAVLPELRALFLAEVRGWQPGACAQVARIKNLRRFGALRVGITDEDVRSLVQLPNINRLDLRETAMTEGGWQMIGKAAGITHVEAGGPDVSSVGLQALAASQSIEWLDLRFCPQLDDTVVDALGRMPKLRKVQLNDQNQTTPAAVQRLARLKPKLLIQHPATDHWERYGWGGFVE